MPLTKVNIWNMALGHVGVTNRVNLDTDLTAEAKACALWWDTTLADVHRAVAWPFATKYAALAGKAAAPNAEWAFSYTYPADAITIRKILDANSRVAAEKSRVPFRRTDALVLTSVDNANAEYTVLITDPTKYSGDFVAALSLLLGARIAPQIAGGNQWKLAATLEEKYNKKIVEAAANASAEEKNIAEESTAAGKPKEDIVNAALALLSVDMEVQNLASEDTIEARTARQFYDHARDGTLRAMHWPFATKIAALAGKAAAPNADWAFSYTYPADSVDIRKILDPLGRIPAGQSRIPFKRGTGGLIFTNQDNASVEYTFRNDTPSEYTSDFRNAFSIRLAMKMAHRLVSIDKLKAVLEGLKALYEEALQEAVSNALKESRDFSPETLEAGEPKENVCNGALALLGVEAEIQDLELEQTREARACRQFYEKVVEQVFRDYDWPWARRTGALAGAVDDPTDEWQYSYTYPATALAVRRIMVNGGVRVETEDNRVEFAVENVAGVAKVFTDETDAVVQYTIRVDEAEWPGDFWNAVTALLASKVAAKVLPADVVQKTRAVPNMLALYSHHLIRAQINAAHEDRPDADAPSSFERSRR